MFETSGWAYLEWGDAEIGAGAGIALGMLAASGALLLTGRRRAQPGT